MIGVQGDERIGLVTSDIDKFHGRFVALEMDIDVAIFFAKDEGGAGLFSLENVYIGGD